MKFTLKRLIVSFSMLFVVALAAIAGEADPSAAQPKEEKPKEKPFKYSAWCVFKELNSSGRTLTKEDPLTDHTRPVSPNWEGFGRRGQWTSIVIELKNTTEKTDYRGSATVNLNPLRENERGVSPYTTTYRQEFEIGPQTEKQFHFSVLCPEDGFTAAIPVAISANGYTDTRYISLHDLDARKEEMVVVVSESSGAFRFLRSENKDNTDQRVANRSVAVVEPQELPTRWHDLMMANLIIVDGPPREKLSDEQWAALKSYAQAGGHVLITAGKDPSRLKGAVEELAGITVREMTEVPGLNGGASNDVNFTPSKADFRLPLVDVSVSPKGSAEVRYSSTKIVEMVTRYYGPGSVTFLPFSLSDRLLENWEGRSIIPVEIINRGRDRGLFSNRTGYDDDVPEINSPMRVGFNMNPNGPIARSDSIVNLRQKLDTSFSDDTPVQMQPKSTVMSFLLFYLLCAVPINYFIFGWFKRREIAWLAVPLWAGSFSVLAYAVGYMGQTGQMTVNEVSVIEAGPGQDLGVARTFLGLYAPIRGEYNIAFPPVAAGDASFPLQAGPSHLVNFQQTLARNIDNPELYLVDGNDGLRIERLRIQQRSTRRLEVVHRAQVGNGMDIKVKRLPNAMLDIEFQNNTGFDLHLPVLIDEGRAMELGNNSVIKPGESRSFESVRLSASPNEAFFNKQIYFKSARGQHARNRARDLSEFVQKQIEKYSRAERAVFCAWIDNERGALPLTVATGGSKPDVPRIEGLTMLIVPVRVREDFSALDLTERAKVRYTQDFTPSNGTPPKWLDVGGQITMRRNTTVNQQPPMSEAFIKVELPKKYRELRNRGYQLKFWATLDAISIQQIVRGNQKNAKPNLDGELLIECQKMGENNRLEWDEVEKVPVLGLKLDNTITVGPIVLPLNNYRAISGDAIQLRLTFIPNQALANFISSYSVVLKNIECKTGRPNSE